MNYSLAGEAHARSMRYAMLPPYNRDGHLADTYHDPRAEFSLLRTLAAQLEATFDGAAEAPTSSPQLLGAWSLVFTDASDVLALGALPATLGDITQTVARAEDALARHFHAAYRADSLDSTPTGGNALLVGAKRALGRARLHENATRAGFGFDAGTRVRRLVRLCCDGDVCK